MKGPISLIRSDRIAGYGNLGSIHEWSEGKAYLIIDKVTFRGKPGAVLCYYNPPVHQVGNPGLDAYLGGLDRVFEQKDTLEFLILYGGNDFVHAGGDLKESIRRLDETLEAKREKEEGGATEEEINRLYDWADNRLRKGVALHGSIRKIAGFLRVVAVCGGGTRYGGSAEIPLMADYLVGDSRSAMCFSEAMIGLIPGWAGVARALVKAGLANAQYMSRTCREVKAPKLMVIGIYNALVDVPFPFPRRQKTDNPESDKADYLKALEDHDQETGILLFPKGLEVATCDKEEIPVVDEKTRVTLATEEEVFEEVARRKNPENYAHLWGKALREIKDEVAKMGRPLAPQSIEALDQLFGNYDPSMFDEHAFVQREAEVDAGLYRDPRLRVGLTATLEQRIADYREVV